MRSWFSVLLVALSSAACMAPPGPMERLSFAAYDMNTATRFGRMDIAASHVGEAALSDFMARHAKWGRSIRVVDLELAGMHMTGKDAAEVNLTVSWHRLDETTIRSSMIQQTWKMNKNGWKMDEEMRANGSPGLFDRPKAKSRKASKSVLTVSSGQL